MAIITSGPGVGLPPPQNLYPSELTNAPNDAPTNYLGLAPGQVLNIPATGTNGWLVDPGSVSVLQYLDPVSGTWRLWNAFRGTPVVVTSDGFTRRLANLTGCPVAAVVAGGGSSFAAATATITANVGGSTWQAIVGGSLSVSTVSTAGKNYTVAPEVFIPAPPAPGVQATAHATISGGSVTAVTLDNAGAGYLTAPTAVLIPNPVDPNVGTITTATVVLVLNAANSGAITAALCTNNGAPLATLSALTLTAAGGSGSGATITPVVMQSVVSATTTAGGAGWGNVAAPAAVTTTGGLPASVSAITNPMVELTNFRPRPAQINVSTSAAGVISAAVVMDPGLFVGTPTAVIISGGVVPTTLASVSLVMGGVNDTVFLQPL
jgi:hypothetical protein